MKKRKCMCMILILSSLCSCQRILLLHCPLAKLTTSTGTRMSGPVVVSHVPPRIGIRPSEPRTSSHWQFQDYHQSSATSSSTSLPQDVLRSYEGAAGNCFEGIAGNCNWESRNANTRKHFSQLRFGTSSESGIQEAKYLQSLHHKTEIVKSASSRNIHHATSSKSTDTLMQNTESLRSSQLKASHRR